jgi:outer membrane protein assembly factor BamB
MYCSGHLRILVLSVSVLLTAAVCLPAQTSQLPNNAQIDGPGSVHLRWPVQRGVNRYRLQVARDSKFTDIAFDKAVTGNSYQINELPPGRYFWRIAPLTNKLGEFSQAAPIEVLSPARPVPSPRPPTVATASPTPATNSVVTRGGWRAAVGDIARPVLARLRSQDKLDLVGINSEGVVFALEASSGITLWRTARVTPNAARLAAPMLIRSRSGTENVVLVSGVTVTVIDGATGRQLWQISLPANALSAAVLNDNRAPEIVIIDSSRQRLFVLDANNGRLLSQLSLPSRVVGAPVPTADQGRRVMIAYESGQVEVRDAAGAVIRTGNAGSPATTPPLNVKGRSGDLILVGTRAGLTAMTSEELRPLGMVAIDGDAPRGTLTAQDLDADGFPEVIMTTDRGRMVVVNATDGKTLWEASPGNETETLAFIDVDGDRVLDIVIAAGQTFASALSGRNGSVLWKDSEPPASAGNHAGSLTPRSVIAMSYGAGVLLIAGDSSRTGLRAIEFPKARINR